MRKMLGMTAAAAIVATAGAAHADSILIAEGTTTGQHAGATFGVPAGLWDVAVFADGPIQALYGSTVGSWHFHYDYDNPAYSYGRKFSVAFTGEVRESPGGLTVRLRAPPYREYRVEDPEFGYTYWEFYNLSGWIDANFAGPGVNYRITMSAAPEPATWAMLIAGFGLVGGALRTRRQALLA